MRAAYAGDSLLGSLWGTRNDAFGVEGVVQRGERAFRNAGQSELVDLESISGTMLHAFIVNLVLLQMNWALNLATITNHIEVIFRKAFVA